MRGLAAWDRVPSGALDLTDAETEKQLRIFYTGISDQVPRRVYDATFRQAIALRAHSAIMEPRYIDADWRSEHGQFYSTTYRRYPSVAHRLHLFSGELPAAALHEDKPIARALKRETYLGYIVLRPVQAAPIGRTMLAVPPRLRSPRAVVCQADDQVNLFGMDLRVSGMPFLSQDGQYMRCAQVCAWITAYYHHLRFGSPRALPELIATHAGVASDLGRPLPSPGLSVRQVTDAMLGLGLPGEVYDLRQRDRASVVPFICRYLNSRLPVTVITSRHAFVLIGYERYVDRDGIRRIRFWRQDDEAGPYQAVDNWGSDPSGTWQHLVVPLPPKVYLTGEHAELIAKKHLISRLKKGTGDDQMLASELVKMGTGESSVALRSSVMLSNDFKRGIEHRRFPDAITARYLNLPMPRYIWVVEVTDRSARDQDDVAAPDCVLAEAVLDATDHTNDTKVLAWRCPSGITRWLADQDSESHHLVSSEATPSVVDIPRAPVHELR
ncbi:hypothetical protein SAMN05660657_02119 [Geodermatophilus amargosae]|uniref:Uncharacterized protein n=1 Tax=Geodermatophilus amargosae TaxID=1296565 RepID=A0A1I6ZMG1_9ACTN|nr:hypothetical protein SAMN05660657_02119 [Geodermatophilus amargosae]